MTDAITAARKRLQDALASGADTAPHRAAIARLEADAAAAARREAEQRAELEAARRTSASARAAELVAEYTAGLDALIAGLPQIPRTEQHA